MSPEGTGRNGVLVMGEALGEQEEKDRLPFRPYAEAGSILERAFYRAGTARQDFTLTNLVWYRPPRNWLDGAPWQDDAIRLCKSMNDQLVARTRPRAILALGGMAMRELTGLSGEKCGIGMTRGFVVPGVQYAGIPVVGSYHPSFLRRGSKEREEAGPRGKVDAAGGGTQGMALLGVLIRDILLAVQVARGGAKPFVYDRYELGASLSRWDDAYLTLQAQPDLPISYDFETFDSLVASDESEFEITRRDVTQVQISYRIGQALVSDWFPELRPILQRILELPNPKLDWNGRKFDRPILREMGIRCDLGEWHDLMDFWHHSQPDLARGLQFATSFHCPEVGPWKHLSVSDPHWYGALDVDMPQRIWEGLRLSCAQTRHPISGISLCSGYQDQVVRLAPVLDRMSARGIPVDEGKRLALDVEFTATLERIEQECQPLVPDELRNVTPRTGYVKTPRELMTECWTCQGSGKVLREITRKNGRPAQKKVPCGVCGGAMRFESFDLRAGWCQREFVDEGRCECIWAHKATKADKDREAFLGPMYPPDCPKCQNTGKVRATFLRWAKVEEFKPGSWQQKLRYIEWMREKDVAEREAQYVQKHPAHASLARSYAVEKSPWKVPIDHKTGKPTTAAAELERLARKTGDLLLPKCLEFTEIDKARGTYVRGWKPGPDGRVHPNFGFKPATGQLSSDNPNAQNFIAHGALAQKMKEMLVSAYA
jgi:uracil-DNA glycosylase family 4